MDWISLTLLCLLVIFALLFWLKFIVLKSKNYEKYNSPQTPDFILGVSQNASPCSEFPCGEDFTIDGIVRHITISEKMLGRKTYTTFSVEIPKLNKMVSISQFIDLNKLPKVNDTIEIHCYNSPHSGVKI